MNMCQRRSLTTVVGLSYIVFLLAFYSGSAYSLCDYETDAKPSDTFGICLEQCRAETGHNNMGCSNYYLYCVRYCSDANQKQCPQVGNPIDVAERSKLDHEVDFQSGGLYPLKIERFYNSAVKMPDGNFGKQWQESSNTKIIAVRNPNTGEETYTLQRLGGGYVAFTYDMQANDGTTYPVKTGVDLTLTLYNYGIDGIPQIMNKNRDRFIFGPIFEV